MSTASQPGMTVADLLSRIEAGRVELDALLAANPPVPPGARSPQDQMAHIACWEHSALALLRGEPRYRHLALDAEAYAAMDLDAINAHITAMFRQRTPAEVRSYFDAIHAELVALISGMGDAGLQLPYSHYQPHDPPYNPGPVLGWITGNTFEHYAEHIAILRGGAPAH